VDCPFCDTASLDPVWSSPLSLAFADRYPVSLGHTLIIPRRHVATWFDATRDEQIDLLDAVHTLKRELDAQLQPKPDGYNVGINAGEAAGSWPYGFQPLTKPSTAAILKSAGSVASYAPITPA